MTPAVILIAKLSGSMITTFIWKTQSLDRALIMRTAVAADYSRLDHAAVLKRMKGDIKDRTGN